MVTGHLMKDERERRAYLLVNDFREIIDSLDGDSDDIRKEKALRVTTLLFRAERTLETGGIESGYEVLAEMLPEVFRADSPRTKSFVADFDGVGVNRDSEWEYVEEFMSEEEAKGNFIFIAPDLNSDTYLYISWQVKDEGEVK
jgi:hypothetical protein